MAGALFTAEFIALFELLRFTTAARATVFIYAAPFFVALGAALLVEEERLRPIQWVGLALAFFGVVCWLHGSDATGGSLTGDALALLAAALRGVDDPCHQGDAAQAHRSGEGPSLSDTGFARAAVACSRLMPSAKRRRRTQARHRSAPSYGKASLSLASATRCGSGRSLTRYAVAQLSAFTFITPLVGVFAGWLVFGEALSWWFFRWRSCWSLQDWRWSTGGAADGRREERRAF